MAVPVKKTSRTEKNIRRNTQKKKVVLSIACPQCAEPKIPHVVCTSCGYYNGRKVLAVGESS